MSRNFLLECLKICTKNPHFSSKFFDTYRYFKNIEKRIDILKISIHIDIFHTTNPKTKIESEAWHHRGEPRRKKVRQIKSPSEVILIAFFDCRGIIYHHVCHPRTTVTKEYYVSILEKLLGHIRRKWPELVGWWILHHDNAHSHTTHVLFKSGMTLKWHCIQHTAQISPCAISGFQPWSVTCESVSSKVMRRSFTKSWQVWLVYSRSNFTKQLKKDGSNGSTSVLQEDTSKTIVTIWMIPNVKTMIYNHFQYSFSFLTFSRPFFGRDRWTWV